MSTDNFERIDLDKITPFAELVNNPVEFQMVRDRFEHIIWTSFGVIDQAVLGHKPKITQKETLRRFKICEKWFRIMRAECGYSLRRTLDTLAKALACELLDQPFDPMQEKDRGWFVQNMSDILEKNK